MEFKKTNKYKIFNDLRFIFLLLLVPIYIYPNYFLDFKLPSNVNMLIIFLTFTISFQVFGLFLYLFYLRDIYNDLTLTINNNSICLNSKNYNQTYLLDVIKKIECKIIKEKLKSIHLEINNKIIEIKNFENLDNILSLIEEYSGKVHQNYYKSKRHSVIYITKLDIFFLLTPIIFFYPALVIAIHYNKFLILYFLIILYPISGLLRGRIVIKNFNFKHNNNFFNLYEGKRVIIPSLLIFLIISLLYYLKR